MAQVRELLERKGTRVLTIAPAATVLQAATLMNEHRVGALVVVEDGRVVGMFSERDVLRRVVGEVMTTAVVCCAPETDVDEARGVMRDRRIRHLPVADADGRLLGLISIGDLNALVQADHEQTVFLLTEYIQGRA